MSYLLSSEQQAHWVGISALPSVIYLTSSTVPEIKWMFNKYILNKWKKGSTTVKIVKPCIWMPQHIHGLSAKDVRGDSNNSELAQLAIQTPPNSPLPPFLCYSKLFLLSSGPIANSCFLQLSILNLVFYNIKEMEASWYDFSQLLFLMGRLISLFQSERMMLPAVKSQPSQLCPWPHSFISWFYHLAIPLYNDCFSRAWKHAQVCSCTSLK